MLEPIPFAGYVEIDESFDRTASHMADEYVSYNEPVAWRNLCVSNIGEDSEWIYNEIGQGEPLYIHPVKELDEQFKKGFEAGKEEGWKAHKFHHPVKELTDEEIMECKYLVEAMYGSLPPLEFAWAILRKAQEK